MNMNYGFLTTIYENIFAQMYIHTSGRKICFAILLKKFIVFHSISFLDLNLSIHNDIVSTKIYDKRDDFNFDIVNFPFLDGDVPRRPSYGVYISQLIRFARASSHVTDFNNRNKFLTAKLLKQGYRYHKLCKAFSKFYRRHFELIEKYHVSLKNLCNKVFVIQNFMEIWYINLRKSLEIQTSLIF